MSADQLLTLIATIAGVIAAIVAILQYRLARLISVASSQGSFSPPVQRPTTSADAKSRRDAIASLIWPGATVLTLLLSFWAVVKAANLYAEKSYAAGIFFRVTSFFLIIYMTAVANVIGDLYKNVPELPNLVGGAYAILCFLLFVGAALFAADIIQVVEIDRLSGNRN